MSHWPSLKRVAQRAFTSALGQTAVLSLEDQSVEVRGVFVPTPSEVESGGAYLRSVQPTLHVPTAALPSWVADGTEVQLAGQPYLVTDLVPDGEGMTELVLRCL